MASSNSADFVTILSSELIADVMQVYFKEKLFKVPVTIVDLKPTADGYAFSLAFESSKVVEKAVVDKGKRDNKGKFHKVVATDTIKEQNNG